MEGSTRRKFFGEAAAVAVAALSGDRLMAQQAPTAAPVPSSGDPMRHHTGKSHTVNGVYYFSGTGSNDGYGHEDHILPPDPFEKHVVRTMDALKKSIERAGCTMDSIIQCEVFLCLPLADGVPMPIGKARSDAHKAQYDALNKIYGTYFSPGQAPSRACMALEWIPGDSLIEIVGCALVVNPPTPPAGE